MINIRINPYKLYCWNCGEEGRNIINLEWHKVEPCLCDKCLQEFNLKIAKHLAKKNL